MMQHISVLSGTPLKGLDRISMNKERTGEPGFSLSI